METVEDCVTETQTGFQRRRPEQSIAADELRASLAAVHSVTDRERAELALRVQDIALDVGEESLWAHALGRINFRQLLFRALSHGIPRGICRFVPWTDCLG